jgi:hypothetical protein
MTRLLVESTYEEFQEDLEYAVAHLTPLVAQEMNSKRWLASESWSRGQIVTTRSFAGPDAAPLARRGFINVYQSCGAPLAFCVYFIWQKIPCCGTVR